MLLKGSDPKKQYFRATHFSLNHKHSLQSHLIDQPKNINELVLLQMLEQIIYDYEGSCSTNPSTKKYNLETHFRIRFTLLAFEIWDLNDCRI